MSKIGQEATNHLPSLVIRMGRGTCVLIVVRRVFLAHKDFTIISQYDLEIEKEEQQLQTVVCKKVAVFGGGLD